MLPFTTTHHQPKYIHRHHPLSAKIYPPPPTISQNISTTTHHQSKYIHHHPPPAKIYLPLPTTSQKLDHQPAKAKVYSYITSFWDCFNNFFFFEMQYSFPWRRFCVIKFWSVGFLSSKVLTPATLLKKRLWHRCFFVNFAKFLRTPFLQNTSWRLILYIL